MLPFLSLLLAVTSVAAHGYVPQIKIGSEYIAGWAIEDGYATPQPLRVVRPTKADSGFIADPASDDITCSIGNSLLPPGPISATVAAGETVSVLWNSWPVGHYGPVINYMAKCPTDDCSVWKGDEGSPWFKIQQDTFSDGVWASDVLANNNATYDVNIPKNIEAGSYLLRHENLALHGGANLGGAQFYPVCIQLTVTGGGSLAPSGLSFPGAYDAEDEGIHYNPYLGDEVNEAYVAPGGDVYPGLN